MLYVWTILIMLLSAFLWLVRGGMEICGKDVPFRKGWYAVGFTMYSCYTLYWGWEIALTAFLACYASYQLFGWGMYLGRLLLGGKLDPEKDKECELIDNLLYPLHITWKGQTHYLYEYPRVFGFLGTSLTGLIITFLWGIHLASIGIMISGLAMGIFYYLGSLMNKLKSDNKGGWTWGELFFGLYLGFVLAHQLLW